MGAVLKCVAVIETLGALQVPTA